MDSLLKDAFRVKASKIIEIGKFIDRKGWVPATAGNLSMRLTEQYIAITTSGKHKARLTESDIMIIDIEGKALEEKRPSFETPLHTILYQWKPSINAIFHTHSLSATVLSNVFHEYMIIEGFEMLKVWPGITTHETSICIPIFQNDQDMPALSQRILAYLQANEQIYGYLLKGHGLYTWGSSASEALHYLEALEFLFEVKHHELILQINFDPKQGYPLTASQ